MSGWCLCLPSTNRPVPPLTYPSAQHTTSIPCQSSPALSPLPSSPLPSSPLPSSPLPSSPLPSNPFPLRLPSPPAPPEPSCVLSYASTGTTAAPFPPVADVAYISSLTPSALLSHNVPPFSACFPM
ncbi:unnamed protein product [Closterium sp. NIES-54]